jgi:Carboxypeptidase regulatory-like domain
MLGAHVRVVVALGALASGICGRAAAQQPGAERPAAQKPRAPPATPRSVVGIVLDTSDVPIDSVEIRIASLQRRTFSDVNGLFRFDNVKPGSYDVAARRLGFAPQVRRVTVANDRGGSVTFSLLQVGYVLPPVVTSSARGGLSGVIGDTAYNVIPRADVYIIGSGHRALTDSAGTFFLGVKPGSYMVQVTRPGFARKLLSVTIPDDSGRHITVWLLPSKGRAQVREAYAIESFRRRMLERRASARFYSREDLNRYDMIWLKQLVVMAAGMPVADECQAVVDGFWTLPIYSLAVDDVESVEVYPPGSLPSVGGRISRTTPPRSINPGGTRRIQSGPVCPTVYVWTRG